MDIYGHIEIDLIEAGTYIVRNQRNMKYVKMGEREKDFLVSLLDGGAQAAAVAMPLDEAQKGFLQDKFAQWGFIVTGKDHSSGNEASPASSGPGGAASSLKKFFSIDIASIKLFTINIDGLLNKTQLAIRALLSPGALLAYIGVIAASWVLLSNNLGRLGSMDISDFGALNIIALVVLILLTTGVHELAHGITCRYYGGRVTHLGVMLFYLIPVMYCDVTDIYMFKNKFHKITVAFAGVFINWILASAGIILYFILLAAGMDLKLILYYSIANIGTGLINLIPLVKLDGYWILVHYTGITNLRDKAFNYLFSGVFRLARKKYRFDEFSPHQRMLLASYAALALIFSILFWGYSLGLMNHYLAMLVGTASVYVTGAVLLIILSYYGYNFFKAAAGGKHEPENI